MKKLLTAAVLFCAMCNSPTTPDPKTQNDVIFGRWEFETSKNDTTISSVMYLYTDYTYRDTSRLIANGAIIDAENYAGTFERKPFGLILTCAGESTVYGCIVTATDASWKQYTMTLSFPDDGPELIYYKRDDY
jgi:hypothetical protein